MLLQVWNQCSSVCSEQKLECVPQKFMQLQTNVIILQNKRSLRGGALQEGDFVLRLSLSDGIKCDPHSQVSPRRVSSYERVPGPSPVSSFFSPCMKSSTCTLLSPIHTPAMVPLAILCQRHKCLTRGQEAQAFYPPKLLTK